MARSYRLTFECLEDRIAPANHGVPSPDPVTYGIAWPNPGQLTLSFAPDGTSVLGSPSVLFQKLTAQELDQNPTLTPQQAQQEWQLAILRAFQTWAVNAGINIGLIQEPYQNPGLPLGTAGAPQGDSRFGDIRIATAPLASNAGGDVVAFSEPYNPLAGTWAGDVELNPAYFGAGSPYDIYSVMLHEAGHVFGFNDNPTDTSSVMYQNFLGIRSGLSAGDIAMMQGLYGMPPADSDAGTVTAINGGHSTFNGDLSTLQDVDTYSYKAMANGGTFTIALHTAGISLLVPKITVYDSKGDVVATESNQSPLDSDLVPITITPGKTSTYTIVVQGAASDVFGMGSYQLVVGTGKTSNAGGNGGGNSQATTINLQAQRFRSGGLFSYADSRSITAANPVALYQFKAPSGAPTMIVTVWGTHGFQPLATLENNLGNAIPTQVLVNQDDTYTFQLPTAPSGAPYHLAIQGEDPNATGDFFLGIGFGAAPIQLTSFISDQVLNDAAPQQVGTLHVLESQLFHMVFTTSGGAGQLTVYDPQGQALQTLTAANGTVTANLVLDPGLYTIQFTRNSGETAPVTFSFLGKGVSDPIGPQPIDTTLDPGPALTDGVAYWWQLGYSAFLSLVGSTNGSPGTSGSSPGTPGTGSPSTPSGPIAGNTPGGTSGSSSNSLGSAVGAASTTSGAAPSNNLPTAGAGSTAAGTMSADSSPLGGMSNSSAATGNNAGSASNGAASNNLGGILLGSSAAAPAVAGSGAATNAGGSANNPGLATVLTTPGSGAAAGTAGSDADWDRPTALGTVAVLQWVVRINHGFGPFPRMLPPSPVAETIPAPFIPLAPTANDTPTVDQPRLPNHTVERGKWFVARSVAGPEGISASNLTWLCACLILGLGVYPLVRKPGRERD